MKRIYTIITVLLSCFLLCSTAFAEDANDTSTTNSQQQETTTETTSNAQKECQQHTFGENEVVEPSCERFGYTKHQCTNCSYVYYDYIKAPSHTLKKTEAKAATCTATGNKEYYTCSVCSKIFADADAKTETTLKDMTIAALGHDFRGAAKMDSNGQGGTHSFKCVNIGCSEYGNATKHTWNDGFVNPSATCTAKGIKTYTCTEDGCGATYTEEVPANGHTKTKTKAKDATCTEDGNIEYWYCSVCEKYFSDEKCTNEIQQKDTVISKHHTWNTDFTNDKEATCLEKGSKSIHCSKCSETKDMTEIPAFGHTFGTVTEKQEPTCTEAGHNEYKQCETCKLYFAKDEETNSTNGKADTSSFVIAAKGHTFNQNSTDAKYLASEKNCTEKAKYYVSCSSCGASSKGTSQEEMFEVGEALGHSLKKTEAKKATCTENGNNEYYTCSTCQKAFKDSDGKIETTVKAEKISAIGHKLTAKPTSWDLKQKTAKVKCNNCKKNININVTVKESVTNKATLSENGTLTLTGSAKVNSKTYTSKQTETIYKIKTVSLSNTSFNYNAKVQKPTVTVKDSQGNVIDSKYYKVTYSNSSSKNIGKYTVTIKFSGKYSGEKTLSYSIILSKVTNLKANGRTLSWNKVTGAKKYEVYIYNSAKKSYQKVATISKNEYKIGKEWKCGNFKVYVVAVNGKTKSAKSSVISFKCNHNWNKKGADCLDCNTVDTVKSYTKVVMSPNKYKVNEKYKSTLTLYVEGKNHNYTLTTTTQPNGFTTKTTGKKTIVFTAYDGVKCTYTVTK